MHIRNDHVRIVSIIIVFCLIFSSIIFPISSNNLVSDINALEKNIGDMKNNDYVNINTDDIDFKLPFNFENVSDSNSHLLSTTDSNRSSSLTTLKSTASSSVSASSIQIIGDFNGDGKDDLAIGVPNEDVGSITDAGIVHVIYGSSSGLSATSPLADQLWSQDSPNIDDVAEVGDEFGSSISTGDFNGDGKDDLAIGVPYEDGSTTSNTGVVHVIYGSSTGLSANTVLSDQLWRQSTPDIEDTPENYDNFGYSLTSGDFNGDGKDDLAIGVPGEGIDVRGNLISSSGMVQVIYGSSSGLSATSPLSDQKWSQDSSNIQDSVGENDNFGETLASGDYDGDGKDDLAIGAQREGLHDSETDYNGLVHIIYGSSSGLSATTPVANQIWSQDSPYIKDSVELDDDDHFGSTLVSGDYNGDGKDDLAIGVFEEDFGSTSEEFAGIVQIIYGSSSGLSATSPVSNQLWSQDSSNIQDTVEHSDRFGEALTSGDFNGDGKDDLAIGVPGENIGDISPGATQIIYGSSSGLSTSALSPQFWTQDSSNISDTSEDFDSFGFSLAGGDFNGDGKDDLAIGVPNEDVGSITDAGATQIIYGSSSGLSATSPVSNQFWTQDSPNIEDDAEIDDEFGSEM